MLTVLLFRSTSTTKSPEAPTQPPGGMDTRVVVPMICIILVLVLIIATGTFWIVRKHRREKRRIEASGTKDVSKAELDGANAVGKREMGTFELSTASEAAELPAISISARLSCWVQRRNQASKHSQIFEAP